MKTDNLKKEDLIVDKWYVAYNGQAKARYYGYSENCGYIFITDNYFEIRTKNLDGISEYISSDSLPPIPNL